MGYVLILGATSDIAMALSRVYSEQGYDLYLAAREPSELELFSKDLRIRTGKDIQLTSLDILDYANHEEFYSRLNPKPIGVISLIGYLGDNNLATSSIDEFNRTITVNFSGVASILNIIANDFEQRNQGFIIGISSVAGDRGRKSNYVYGAAKAAFTTYLSGLRHRFYGKNIHVMTVKPGFVDTKMTANMDLPKLLTASAEQVAQEIYQAQVRKKDVIYSKKIWRMIMFIIKNIPEFIFKKMNF